MTSAVHPGIRMIPWPLCVIVVAMALDGCAASHGLSREALTDVILEDESRFIGTPIGNTSSAPTPMNAPTLGLYLKPTGYLHREFEWTGRDRDTVLAWSQKVPLRSGGRSAGFVTVSSLRGQTLTELRASAKRYGFDWLLVFDGAAAVDRYNNYKAALLYWTIVGAYLADGTESDALCVLKATLWDVTTGAQLFSEQADARTEQVGPAPLVDDKAVLDSARTKALEQLLRRLEAQFQRFKVGR